MTRSLWLVNSRSVQATSSLTKESFRASLALALALAEGLSGLSHGRSRFALESLFLEEGFGTLDPETLNVGLQGIEALGTSERLVGIVSHIPELAERMPS